MKRTLAFGLVAAGIAAAAGCSTNSQGASMITAVSATAMPSPSHPATYASQVVLPFGEYINHLAGVASSTTATFAY
jgi:hypothetical protein